MFPVFRTKMVRIHNRPAVSPVERPDPAGAGFGVKRYRMKGRRKAPELSEKSFTPIEKDAPP